MTEQSPVAAGDARARPQDAPVPGSAADDTLSAAAVEPDPADGSAPRRGFWTRRTVWQRAALSVLVVASVISAMMVLLAVGMWRNDMVIDDSPVRTTATVLTVSATSTGIEFVDNQGVSQRPPGGVLYPGGLAIGQQFLVEYASTDPTLARVAGRTAVNGLIMPVFVVIGTWIVTAGLLWWIRSENRVQPSTVGAAVEQPQRRRRRLSRR